MTRPLLTVPLGFAPQVVDKVERLLEVLSALRDDAFLGEMFVLHGGTALNVFHERVPRLSVDIDLMFVGAVDVDEMRRLRPQVDGRFREVIGALGYVVRATNDEHSGQTYRLQYPGDYVKVDISYLARVALLEPEVRICEFADPPVAFPVLQLPELVAGKIQAMMERVAARDLYDLYRLALTHPALFDDSLVRALAVRAICASNRFPFVTRPVDSLDRFENPTREFTEPLYAMLNADDAPDYEQMLASVAAWLAPLGGPIAPEAEFMRRLRESADYRPDLLFANWPDVAGRAAADPVMAWKVQNLRTLLGETQ
ncbi:MAG: hypothetical protein FD171_1066 [Actinobacteria bacterium]|nr:MAG: hypothetical protein FD171_1066 [Actinomycetota bacterium]